MKACLISCLEVSPRRLALLGVVFAALAFSAGVARAAERSDGAVETSTEVADEVSAGTASPFVMNYTNILYGPTLSNPSSFLPTLGGTPDPQRPIFMKNFLSASYGLNANWALTATAYWWYRPVMGQSLTMQDPFVRVSNVSLFHTDWGLNLYGDLRVHMGVTSPSRDANFITGFQNFDYLTYTPVGTRVTLGLRTSARYNVYGKKGYGPDAEFYLAPEATYRLSSKFALTSLYEMGASHSVGDKATYFTNDGTDLEPGIEWDPTPDIVVNPYLTLLTGGKISLASTSVGMFFTWNFL